MTYLKCLGIYPHIICLPHLGQVNLQTVYPFFISPNFKAINRSRITKPALVQTN